jgi:hypothetical protein
MTGDGSNPFDPMICRNKAGLLRAWASRALHLLQTRTRTAADAVARFAAALG